MPTRPDTDSINPRFERMLAEELRAAAGEAGISVREARRLVYAAVTGRRLQERRAPAARHELARTLGPSLADFDPVPYETVAQAQRLAALRTSLLRSGALSTAAIARARGITPNNARQWISRHRQANRIFTVSLERETLVPAFLLDEAFEPRVEAREPIGVLRDAGEDGWALWAWFATPSAWLGGRIPAELLTDAPERLAESARQRARAAR